MCKMHLPFLLLAFLEVIVEASHGGVTLDTNTKIVASMFTPFNKNGGINMPVLKKMAEKLHKDNITHILIASYAGEGPSMGLCIRKALIEAWVTIGVRLGLKVMVEIGAIAFPDLLKLAKFCARLDVTAIFVYPEICYKAKSVGEVIEDLHAIYKEAPKLPMVYHDSIFQNEYVSSLEVLIEGSKKIPTLCGLSTGLATAVEVARVVGQTNKTIFVYGNDVNAPLVLNIGIHSSLYPCLYPKLILEIAAAVEAGECEKAAELQLKLSAIIAATTQLDGGDIDYLSRPSLARQKLVYKLITGLNLRQRRPLRPVSATNAEKIKNNLKNLGVILKQ